MTSFTETTRPDSATLKKWTEFLINHCDNPITFTYAEAEPTNIQRTINIIYDILRAKVGLIRARKEIELSLTNNDDVLILNVERLIQEGGIPLLERLELELVRNCPYPTKLSTLSPYRVSNLPSKPDRPTRNQRYPIQPTLPYPHSSSWTIPTLRWQRKAEWRRRNLNRHEYIQPPRPDHKYTQECISSFTVQCWTDPEVSELLRIPNNPFWNRPRVHFPPSSTTTSTTSSHPSMPELVTPQSSNSSSSYSPNWSDHDSSWDRNWSPEKYRRTPTPGFETPPSPLQDVTLATFKEELEDDHKELDDNPDPIQDETHKITIKTPTSPRYDPDLCMKCQKADHEFIHCPDKTQFPQRSCIDRSRHLNDYNDDYDTVEGLEILYRKYDPNLCSICQKDDHPFTLCPKKEEHDSLLPQRKPSDFDDFYDGYYDD